MLGDIAALERTAERIRHAVDPVVAGQLDAELRAQRLAAGNKDLTAVTEHTTTLRRTIMTLPKR